MSKFKVLLTDYAWADLEIERRVLGEADCELVVAPDGREQTLSELARDCQAIMTNWAKVSAGVIAAARECRIVSRLGIGLDNIDVAYCTAHGIPVTNVPDYCLIEVAEHALAMLLALARKIGWYHLATKQGRYELQAGPRLKRIEGQTLGIVGFGNIGRRLAEKARGLGLNILATTRRCPAREEGVSFCPLPELLARSQYVSLHLPLTSETRHTIAAAQLARMQPTAYLINTARGGLVDHAALAAALAENRLAGAALDVQPVEPPDLTQAPFNDPRVIVTPHAAFVSQEALENLRYRTARQVAGRLAGERPENVVNPTVLGG